jgi:two-component system cell cycle sensor histidine kinase/response regulator CckA
MEQVIANLVRNARDAMPEGGCVGLSTERLSLQTDLVTAQGTVPAGTYAVLHVNDTGVGMDEEAQCHLFEPFFTTKAEGRGTGLGLSVVYGIVQQSGGHIWFETEPGRGTTFHVALSAAADTSDDT